MQIPNAMIVPSENVLSVALAHAGSGTIHAVRSRRIRDVHGAVRDHQSDRLAICGTLVNEVEPFLPWAGAVKVDHRVKCSKCRRATGLVVAFVLLCVAGSLVAADNPTAVSQDTRKPVVTVYVAPDASCIPCNTAKRELTAATDLPFDVKFSSKIPNWVTTLPVAVWRTDEPRQLAGWYGTRRLTEAWQRTHDEVKPDEPRSPQWRAVRDRHITSHPTCIVCGVRGTQVHHLVPFSRDPSKELDPTNLRTVCDRCHIGVAHLGNFKNENPDLDRHAEMLLRAKQEADRRRMTPRTTP